MSILSDCKDENIRLKAKVEVLKKKIKELYALCHELRKEKVEEILKGVEL